MNDDVVHRMQQTMAAESACAARNRLYAAKAKKEDALQLAKLMTALAEGEQISARCAAPYPSASNRPRPDSRRGQPGPKHPIP